METYVVEVEKLVCIKGTVTIDAVNPQEAEDMTIQRINSKELTVFSDDIEWDYYENEYQDGSFQTTGYIDGTLPE